MMILSNTNSLFNSVTYRLGSTVVDPGDSLNFKGVTGVLLTHAHFDHIYGLNRLVESNSGVKVFTNEYGREMLLDERKNMSRYHDEPFVFKYPENIVVVRDNDEITLADGTIIRAVYTPGHNPSCITWVTHNSLFTGDAYIPGCKTVTNLPGGNKALSKESENIILTLSETREIYPGHKLI